MEYATGLEAYGKDGARPLLNSASLERIGALDMAIEHGCRVVVTAAGESGMPSGVVPPSSQVKSLTLYTVVDNSGDNRTSEFPLKSSHFFEQSLELQEPQPDFSRDRCTLERRLRSFETGKENETFRAHSRRHPGSSRPA